jgi:hypothetical protein
MIRFITTIIVLLLSYFSSYAKNKEPQQLINELHQEIKVVQLSYFNIDKSLQAKKLIYKQQLANAITLDEKVNLLILKDIIEEDIKLNQENAVSEIGKIRYIKGLQIIKQLYEKVLGLDHHFASVRTFSEINKMANPNQYPEYEKLKALVKEKRDKKTSFDLTQVLGTNTIVSVVNTFTNMLVSSLSKEEKEKELQNIDCILDFTLRMQNDLNTIYFETAFLQKSNETIKGDIEVLFRDFTKPIGYTMALTDCRNQDDWDKVLQMLGDYLKKIQETDQADKRKLQVELSFPIDRLIAFITQYNNFINEGVQFYQKFDIILNSYENEKQCETKLPLEYKKLKQDVNVAIDKFNVAYKPVEINGTKMKEILYGINEFQ